MSMLFAQSAPLGTCSLQTERPVTIKSRRVWDKQMMFATNVPRALHYRIANRLALDRAIARYLTQAPKFVKSVTPGTSSLSTRW
jgi:hypothetical protein